MYEDNETYLCLFFVIIGIKWTKYMYAQVICLGFDLNCNENNTHSEKYLNIWQRDNQDLMKATCISQTNSIS